MRHILQEYHTSFVQHVGPLFDLPSLEPATVICRPLLVSGAFAPESKTIYINNHIIEDNILKYLVAHESMHYLQYVSLPNSFAVDVEFMERTANAGALLYLQSDDKMVASLQDYVKKKDLEMFSLLNQNNHPFRELKDIIVNYI